MEEKRREAGMQPAAASSAAAGAASAASEPASSRRRGGAQKRKAAALSATNASSTPSKRMTREKNLTAHPPIYNHNGPLTRARQGPTTLPAAASDGPTAGGKLEAARDDTKRETVEELNKASEEWEALEAKFEADFQAIRSRDRNVHVVPTHCGWFSWTKCHPLEEQALPSFFNGKSQERTPDNYMEIRNWIMKKFHSNPNTQIELKDLSELEVGSLDARQEVMEFLDYWGLINFHPSIESTVTNGDGDKMTDADSAGAEKKDSLLEKLYRFEEIKACLPVAQKPNIAFPALPSGLFPESAIAEELAKLEEPSVEYHCNSCSADCSRKRYHCQKQADFDLCTDCFNNGKFGSGMSSSDFILMVPAEAAGVNGGKWSDQETLLLLEALELYKENWNEIAEHVATKTKAQCILHFVQMPIEDAFLDCDDDDVDANSKETADPSATNGDTSASKDVPETSELKTGAEGQTSSPVETSKPEEASEIKVCKDTLKPKDESKVRVDEQMSKSEDNSEEKFGQDTDENIALKALREAFEAVGYLPTPESPHSFAEVGNPVMALAAFLAQLVGPEMATVSARSSLKSISGDSPAMQLAAQHCFILEDPPADKKDPAHSESIVAELADQDTRKDENLEDRNIKEINSTSVLDERDLSNDRGDKITEGSFPEEKRQSASLNDKLSEKSHDTEGPGNHDTPDKVEPGDINELSNPKSPRDNQPSTVEDSNVPPFKVPPSSQEKSGKGSSCEPSTPMDVVKDVNLLSDSFPSGKNEPDQPVTSNSVAEPSRPSKAKKDVDMISDPLLLENDEPGKQITPNSKVEPSLFTEASKDVEMVSASLPSEINEPHQTHSVTGTETAAGEDQVRCGKDKKRDPNETKEDHNIDKVKRAAVSALSAAAVKSKLLACQEEDQVRLLATSLIEKQLQKLEAKLAFFNELDNLTLRVREQLERSRQRLYQERALIIQARLGPSRAMQPSMPANRIPMTFANSVARPPMSTTSPRPPISRSMGGPQTSSIPSHPFGSTTAGSSIRPSSQDNLSSVGMK